MSGCCAHGLASLSQSLCSRYVQVESWANCLHAARIGPYSGWPPMRCVRTASPTSRTIIAVQGGLRLLADCNGRRSSDIPKGYTGARDSTFARSARGFLSVTDTYRIYSGYFSRGNIFVKVVILAISWKKFRGRAVCLLFWARARGVFRG